MISWSTHIFVFSVLSFLVICQCTEEKRYDPTCPPFNCGKLGQVGLPFSNSSHSKCGFFVIRGCDRAIQNVQLQKGSNIWFEVENISQTNTISIWDRQLEQHLKSRKCETLTNLSLPSKSYLEIFVDSNITLFKCNHSRNSRPPVTDYNYTGCDGNISIYYNHPNKPLLPRLSHCSVIQLPVNEEFVNAKNDPFNFLAFNYSLELHVSLQCIDCVRRGGLCQDSKRRFQCVGLKGSKNRSSKIWAGIGGSAVVILVICSVAFVFWYCYRKKYASSNLFFVKPSDPSSESSLGRDSAYFGVPVFTYGELELATNHFDSAKELGDGGFGTVYYGKLRDGREVAVKRLYENNYKRVEQFINEINILTRLRHQNLVTLYGCTSRRSRELLLVYEFIPNGTVADHLHGDRSTSCLLTWPVRLRIATETASALAYLHASDIIHRDVKTHNILLDINFCVKVADFGLSRLFPTYATHISTAPQGTPGYVDPEYHKCYQLTEKSDVYSFGVVLIELISSMPAVDICRDREEINLSTLAMNRIQNQAYHHLVDPNLGFDSDHEIRRMTILVAELAFQCLQPDKDERPSMDEILRVLRRIQGEQNEEEKLGEADDRVGVLTVRPPASPESEDKVLLKRMHLLSSPTSVTDKWVSTSTTPNVSV